MLITQITEGIPMSPKHFATAIESGSTKNVMVGLEFEVCVKPSSEYIQTIIRSRISMKDIEDELNDTSPIQWDMIFDNTSKFELYELYQHGYIQWFNVYVVDKVIPNLDSEQQAIAMKGISNSSDPYTSCKEFVEYLNGNVLLVQTPTNANVLGYGCKHNNIKLSKEFFIIKNLNVIRDIIGDKVKLDMLPYDGNYLREPIESAFGSAIVFEKYHENPKTMFDWYIEPDPSIKPSSGSFGAEVVSPPLDVKEAITALKTFYKLATDNHWYTNGSTGLHINVSIPADVDPLKLALVSGDYHVLKKYDRQVSEYARSIERSLSTDQAMTGKFAGLKNSLQQAIIPLVAKEAMEDHYSSISIAPNGKYISFRHVGGDYLNDISGVINIIGRFVRSMIIASDPYMYRNEYLKKLSKIITPTELSESTDIQYSIIDGSADLQSIAKFIASGNEVTYDAALSGLTNAELIGVAKSSGKIIAVRVLKNPNHSYKNKVFMQAGIDSTGYDYELGYNMVDPTYRNMGISTKLGQLVLSKSNSKVFATTRSNNTFANKGLITLGFKPVGEPYPSVRGNYTLQLWVQ